MELLEPASLLRYSNPVTLPNRHIMIFEPTERILLPTKDLLSFIFDNPPYDQDAPVGPYLVSPVQY